MGIWDDYGNGNGKNSSKIKSKKTKNSLFIILIALILFFSMIIYRAYDLKKRELDLKLRLNEIRVDSIDVRSAPMAPGALFHASGVSHSMLHTLWDPLNQLL